MIENTQFDTIDDLPDGADVLMRVDLNAPLSAGEVQDNARFERHAETVQELAEAGHAVTLLAHQGRPGRDDFSTLAGHADVLAGHLDRDVAYVPDVYGDDALEAIRGTDAGEVLLLENVRSVTDELADRSPAGHADSEFVRTLAPEFDCYVNDAYSAAHRPHASLVGFPQVMDAYAGRVMVAEYEANTAIRGRRFDGPVAMVLGGTKASDLIPVIEALSDRVDRFLLGGIVGELFCRAAGHDVGYDVGDTDRFDEQWAEHGDQITAIYESHGDSIELPRDLAYETADGDRAEVAVEDAAKSALGRPFLDVGRDTVAAYEPVVADSAATFVKGALGVFEDERFADGTRSVLDAVGAADCFSVVGGGDTARAVGMYDLGEDRFDHVSIAGGAYVRALTGEPLPAVEALREN